MARPTAVPPLSVSAAGKPRLQIFVNDLSATGVVRNAIGIAHAAVADGFCVRLLTSVAGGALQGELDPRVELIALVSPEVAQMPRTQQLRRSLIAYRQRTERWKPHVLFSAGNHGHLLSTLAWAGLPGAKILRISNELDRDEGKSLPKRMSRSAKFRLVTSRANRLVLVSHALENRPVLKRKVKRGQVVVIPNGVDVEAIRAQAAQACPHRWLTKSPIPVVLAVGRHVRQKNFATLLQAFALARRERPIRLLFLGEGKAEAIAELRAHAQALSVGTDVGFEPPTANPFTFMHSADVVALPSLWEGSANVLLEALACGTPVVASRTAGDAARVLDNGRFGLIVDPNEPQEIASALLRQIGPEPVLPGDRAESFSRQASLARYVELFRSCLPAEFAALPQTERGSA